VRLVGQINHSDPIDPGRNRESKGGASAPCGALLIEQGKGLVRLVGQINHSDPIDRDPMDLTLLILKADTPQTGPSGSAG
jgi:hypothetical protein